MAIDAEISFTMTGEFDPNEITSEIGIIPTKTWRLGECIPKTILRRKHDGWYLSIRDKDTKDLELMVKKILEQIYPKKLILLNLYKKFNMECGLSCFMYITGDDRPAMHFDRGIIKYINELNAELDIDIYFLGEDDEA